MAVWNDVRMNDRTTTGVSLACARVPAREWLSVRGDDAVSFIDGLITQDVAAIDPGSCALGMFLTAKARIITPAWIHRRAEDTVLLELLPGCSSELVDHLRRYRLRARVDIVERDLSALRCTGDTDLIEIFDNIAYSTQPQVEGLVMIGTTEDIDQQEARLHNTQYWQSWTAMEAARIDAGIPDLIDLVTDAMPAEVGADDLGVSYTKGCYLGQEPVARLHWRGHANRTLRRLQLSDDPAVSGHERPLVLAAYGDGTRSAGHVSSWARGDDGVVRALGSVRREVPAGAVITVEDVSCTATVLA